MPERPRILTVESEQRPAFSLASAVSHESFDVVSAPDASSAINAAREARPNAVVLSSRVLGGGGLVVLKRLRASVHTASVPVVGVAGTKFEREALREGGAVECLAEPVAPPALREAVERHLASPPVVLEAPSEIVASSERLDALNRTGLLDQSPDERVDSLTRLAGRLLDVPTMVVTLVAADRQFFLSHAGLPDPWASTRNTPLSHSFCQWVVSANEDLVVSDAREHPTLRANLAIRDLNVIAYAGVPVSAYEGRPIGSFCAIDSKPRTWTDDDLATLRDLREVIDAYIAMASERDNPGVAATAARKAISGATRVLLRGGPRLGEAERRDLIAIIDHQSRQLIAPT